MTFKLYIMRHAKSDWSGAEVSDFDRPINNRGQANAKRIGKWMSDNNSVPHTIVSSPALRAKQTTELVVSEYAADMPERIVYDKDLYLADIDALLEIINVYRNDLPSLMIVAHNPGLDELYNWLCMQAKIDKPQSVTTANLFIFSYPENEDQINFKSGKLIEFIKPKLLD